MPRLSKQKLAEMGKKITSEAKKIRATSKTKQVTKTVYSMPWKQAMKQAGRKLKGKL